MLVFHACPQRHSGCKRGVITAMINLCCCMQVEDTAFDQNPQLADSEKFWGDVKLHDIETKICMPLLEGTLTREDAGKMAEEMGIDSCKEKPGPDNIFNYMSYSPKECMMEFTAGQVTQMQQAIIKHRPGLYKNCQVGSA
jgi:hypothetical protein